jgi:DNA repair protein RecN (Recombination protein N)
VQVLVVTHSPQVAAKGRTHWKVAKRVSGKQTHTSVTVLDDAARKEELARMLAGETITDASRQAAAALLKGAAA